MFIGPWNQWFSLGLDAILSVLGFVGKLLILRGILKLITVMTGMFKLPAVVKPRSRLKGAWKNKL